MKYELHIFLAKPPTLWCDNLGATYLLVNLVLHSRTKACGLTLDYHFVRECVAANSLRVSFVSSKDQLADIFTKPLSTARFTLMRSSLNVSQVTLASRGAMKTNNSSTNKSSKLLDDITTKKEDSRRSCSTSFAIENILL